MKEPAVIGYPNQKGVTIERVTYPARNLGADLVANVFKPPGFDGSRQHPAIVVTHPFGGVKEQTAGLYAQRLAEEGFITVAFFPFEQVETIAPRPILMVVGGKADTRFWSDEVYAKARQPKELVIIDGATHIDMYDKPQFVTPAVAKLKEFFEKYLA